MTGHLCWPDSPARVLTPRPLRPTSASVEIVVAGPWPGVVAHLGRWLLLLHLLLKAHGRHRKRHHLVWRESAIHCGRAHLHRDALLPWSHEAVG